MLLNEFEKTQIINESEIKCDECGNNKANSYKKLFYKCIRCKQNLFSLCNAKHDESHGIIKYEIKNYVCEEHNEKYISFCNNCKKIYV